MHPVFNNDDAVIIVGLTFDKTRRRLTASGRQIYLNVVGVCMGVGPYRYASMGIIGIMLQVQLYDIGKVKKVR